jgi:hypothetical protein
MVDVCPFNHEMAVGVDRSTNKKPWATRPLQMSESNRGIVGHITKQLLDFMEKTIAV